MGSQHPSPDVRTLCNFELQIWPEIITSRDAESTCFKGSRTSCDVILAAQKSHRKIAVTTVAADRLATISLQKSQGFPPRRPQKKSLAASDFGMQPQLAFKIAGKSPVLKGRDFLHPILPPSYRSQTSS